MMHTTVNAPALRDTPDVTCSSDVQDSGLRKKVVHREEIPGQSKP